MTVNIPGEDKYGPDPSGTPTPTKLTCGNCTYCRGDFMAGMEGSPAFCRHQAENGPPAPQAVIETNPPCEYFDLRPGPSYQERRWLSLIYRGEEILERHRDRIREKNRDPAAHITDLTPQQIKDDNREARKRDRELGL